MSDALINKYRPQEFKEVIGQSLVVKSLKANISSETSKTFLFTGPGGTGKTTLARIVAAEFEVHPQDVQEVDAATYTGIDAMRELTSGLLYRPIGGGKKAIILDECHMLSKSAWNSLLKILEEPPEWVYWFMCTTEPGKVPTTIRTRASTYELKPVPQRELADWLAGIAEAEGLDRGEEWGGIVDLCAKEAGGSPRQALANLGVAGSAKTRADAADLLKSAQDSEEAVELARALYKQAGWPVLHPILQGLQEQNAESIRQVIRAYFTKIILSEKTTEKQAVAAMDILDAFSQPFNSGDGISPVIVAVARLRFL